MKKKKKRLQKFIKFVFSFQFSKLIILFETLIVAYTTYEGVQLAKLSILNQFDGSLPWIASMVGCAWAAYGVSVSFYYNKSKAEQIKKIDLTGMEFNPKDSSI